MLPSNAAPSHSVERSEWADKLALVVIDNLSRQYPYAAHHLTEDSRDTMLPMSLHPAFANSFDWHSSVHMHWLATRLLSFGVDATRESQLRQLLETNLTHDNLAIEGSYLTRYPHYERPYGWAWALRLAAEVHSSTVPAVAGLAANVDSLIDAIVPLAIHWTKNVPQPVRHGVHSNSAFGLRLLLESARRLRASDLISACETAARSWYGADHAWPIDWERSGQDFLSPGLAEADLMQCVLTPAEFCLWAVDFFSDLRENSPLLSAAVIVDERDPQQSHLFGLDLTRAASAARISDVLQSTESASPRELEIAALLRASIPGLLAAGLEASVSDEYYSTHWLATFAWEALEAIAGRQ